MEFYFINTNQDNAPNQYPVWLENNLAFEHKYPDERLYIDALAPGDICLMYINKQGVKAVGEVLDRRDEMSYQHHMIKREQRTDRDEYRIAVDCYLVLHEPITHAELKNRWGILYTRGTVLHIEQKDRVAELMRHLEKEHMQLSQEVDNHFEGKRYSITVNAYERDPKARAKCIACYGCYCAVCGFDFEATYGNVGKGVIEVHHITPLSLINQEYQINPVKDLIPVCSNCHTIIHKRKPPYDIKEARGLLE